MPILLKNLIDRNYLIKESRSVKIDENQVKGMLYKNCNDSLAQYQDGNALYRALRQKGYDKQSNAYYINPTGEERTSRDTNNLYTALFSTLPSWQEYPKRSYSIFMLNSAVGVDDYGSYIYYVFAYDGAKFAQCSVKDLLLPGGLPYADSVLRLKDHNYTANFADLRDFIKFVNYDFYMKWFGNKGQNYIQLGNIDEFLNDLNEVFNIDVLTTLYDKLASTGVDKYNTELIKKYIEILPKNSSKPWYDFFNDILDPKKNKIGLYNIDNLNYRDMLETWTDSECILVKYDSNILSNL